MSNLSLIIGGNSAGAQKAINDVSLSLKEQRAILKQLQQDYANLDTTAARGKAGKLIADDIKIANAEIKRLEAGSVSSFGAIGSGATKALSAVRSFAYILPGIGVAGIIGGIADMAIGLFRSADAFSSAQIAAANFGKTIKDVEREVADFASEADFEGKIEKIKLALSGLSGTGLTVAGRGVDIKESGKQISFITDEIKRLTNEGGNLLKFNTDFSKTFGQKIDPKIFKDGIPEGIIAGLSSSDQKIAEQFNKGNEQIKKLTEQRLKLFRDIALNASSIGLDVLPEKKTSKAEPYRDPYKFENIKMVNSVFNVEEFKRFQIENKAYRAKVQAELEAPYKVDLKVKLQPMGDGLEAFKKQLLDQLKAYEFYGNKIADIFTNAFDAIAQGKNVFKAIGQSIKQLVVDMIKLAIRTFIVQKILSFVAPVGALKGLSILGGGGLPGFAAGGRPPTNRPSIIGENGPELFIPDTAGRVIPNNALSSYAGSAAQMISGSVVVRMAGRDLVGVLALENAYQRRNG